MKKVNIGANWCKFSRMLTCAVAMAVRHVKTLPSMADHRVYTQEDPHHTYIRTFHGCVPSHLLFQEPPVLLRQPLSLPTQSADHVQEKGLRKNSKMCRGRDEKSLFPNGAQQNSWKKDYTQDISVGLVICWVRACREGTCTDRMGWDMTGLVHVQLRKHADPG